MWTACRNYLMENVCVRLHEEGLYALTPERAQESSDARIREQNETE